MNNEERPEFIEYAVKGRYSFHGEEHPHVGFLRINMETHIIQGYILDPVSNSGRHVVEGKVHYLDDKIVLYFAKKPVGTLNADIFYKLEKFNESAEKILDGKYEGFWSFGDQEVIQLGTGFKEGEGPVAMIIPETEKENKTYLTLDSKI